MQSASHALKRQPQGTFKRARWAAALPLAALALFAFGASSAFANTTSLTRTAYVANFSDDTVTPVNTATNTAGTPISVGDGPTRIAITPDGKTAYVVNQNAST